MMMTVIFFYDGINQNFNDALTGVVWKRIARRPPVSH